MRRWIIRGELRRLPGAVLDGLWLPAPRAHVATVTIANRIPTSSGDSRSACQGCIKGQKSSIAALARQFSPCTPSALAAANPVDLAALASVAVARWRHVGLAAAVEIGGRSSGPMRAAYG